MTITPAIWDSLAEASAKINLATEEISRSIAVINRHLAKLNIGIPAWSYLTPVNGTYDRIGYAKLHGRWGLLIGSGSNEWHFNDAPRRLRLEAINSIPDLLSKMSDGAVDIARLIEAKLLRMREHS